MTNQVSREDIINHVKEAFAHSISPFVTSKDITQDQANRFFKSIFASPDLVELIHQSLKDYSSKTYFSGVDFAKEDCVLVARDGFQEVKFHSMQADFSIYIKETYEPRDCATYVTLYFRLDNNY